MKTVKKILLVSFIFFASLVACLKSNITTSDGIVKDYTGLDGCGLMIDLDSGERLEVVRLPNNETLISNRKVALKYKIVQRMSNCMAGKTAEIKHLQYL